MQLYDDYFKTNREQRMTAVKNGAYWCSKCDADKVRVGEKCGNCGNRPDRKTLKKETNAR